MIPPIAAQTCDGGCSITTTVPSSVMSTQWEPAGTALGLGIESSSFGTSSKVEAGAMIFGCSSMWPASGDVGEKGTTDQESDISSDCLPG